MAISKNSDIVFSAFDPSRPEFEPYGLTCVRWDVQRMPRPDHHNEIEFNCLSQGAVTYILGSKKVTVEAGKLGVFWAANPHQIIDFEPGTAYFVVTVPLQDFLTWRLPEPFVKTLMNGNLVTEQSDECAESDLKLFAQWEADLRLNPERTEKPVLLEIQARLARMAMRYTHVTAEDYWANTSNKALSKVDQIALFIAKNYTQKLSIAEVANHVGLHPNYAMSLFQKAFGTTLMSYLTQYRVSHAQRLLTTTNLSVTDIAYLSGFQSISRFNSAFVQASNCSPRTYRQLHSDTYLPKAMQPDSQKSLKLG